MLKPNMIGENRLKRVLINDKKEFSPELTKILKSELYEMFDNYLSVKRESMDLRVVINGKGGYDVVITFNANYIKSYGIVV